MGQIRHPASTVRSFDSRRESAKEQAEERAKRSATQQLKELDIRLGKDMGAIKERARLNKERKAGN